MTERGWDSGQANSAQHNERIKMQTTKSWLGQATWEMVVSVNQSLCESQKVIHRVNSKHEAARKLWESGFSKKTSLVEAFDLCRLCNDLRPFVFNCSNTFTSIGRTILEDWAQRLSSLDAHKLRTTVAHYIDGQVRKKELRDVLQYLESKTPLSEAKAQSPAPIIPPVHQRQPA
jgi:hypothetical protein